MKLIYLSFLCASLLYAQVDSLTSNVAHWKTLQKNRGSSVSVTKIMAGKVQDLETLNVFAETVQPGEKVHLKKHTQLEEVIIVKEGTLKISVKEQQRLLSPGSVALIYPADNHFLENTTKAPVSYYVFRYKAKMAPDFVRGEKAGGSFMVDWNELEYIKSDIGGRRDYFNRPTAMVNNFEMHVSTLNEGLTNHKAHTHKAEEFVVLVKGDVVMLVGEENYKCSTGDVVFISSMVPHSLNNTGTGETMYFAFQFWQ